MARVLRDVDRERDPFPEKITLGSYLKRWCAHQEARLRPRTLARYRQLLEADVLPLIGQVTLDRLRPAHVQSVLTAMEGARCGTPDDGSGPSGVSSALRTAVAWGLITVNPVTAVRPPKPERPKLVVPTGDQLIALVDAAKGTVWEPAVLLAATTGARRSEVLAMRWSDVDLSARTVHITRSLQRINHELRFADPKTDRARRTVPLPALAVEGLRRWRLAQQERRLAIGPAWIAEDLVCERGDGGPCDPDAFTRALPRLARAVGLPPGVRLHDLRHAVATTLLEHGVDTAIASAVLGHASPMFTASVYQHIRPGLAAQAARAMDEALGSGT